MFQQLSSPKIKYCKYFFIFCKTDLTESTPLHLAYKELR